MRALMIPALAAGVLSASIAFAAETAMGEIKALDASAHTLTLASGETFHLASSIKETGFKVGEKVKITWEKKGDVNEASKVAVEK